jgi:hypothetical protein
LDATKEETAKVYLGNISIPQGLLEEGVLGNSERL